MNYLFLIVFTSLLQRMKLSFCYLEFFSSLMSLIFSKFHFLIINVFRTWDNILVRKLSFIYAHNQSRWALINVEFSKLLGTNNRQNNVLVFKKRKLTIPKRRKVSMLSWCTQNCQEYTIEIGVDLKKPHIKTQLIPIPFSITLFCLKFTLFERVKTHGQAKIHGKKSSVNTTDGDFLNFSR